MTLESLSKLVAQMIVDENNGKQTQNGNKNVSLAALGRSSRTKYNEARPNSTKKRTMHSKYIIRGEVSHLYRYKIFF